MARKGPQRALLAKAAQVAQPKPEDKLARANEQGQAQYNAVARMVADLQVAEEQDRDGGADETEAPRRRIEEDALSVQVRSGWYLPGSIAANKPEEYEILLCTGGPACRIVGELDEYREPYTAQMQVQDWFQPWTDFYPKGEDTEETLLAYARVFYFGD